MAKPRTYDQGDVVRIEVQFNDVDANPADPTTISLMVQDADGTQNTYTYAGGTVSKVGTGHYYRDHDLTGGDGGWWYYRWVGAGALIASEEGRFFVRKAVNA